MTGQTHHSSFHMDISYLDNVRYIDIGKRNIKQLYTINSAQKSLTGYLQKYKLRKKCASDFLK